MLSISLKSEAGTRVCKEAFLDRCKKYQQNEDKGLPVGAIIGVDPQWSDG